jgi:hypothetical protein
MLMNFIHHIAANYHDIVSDLLKTCKTIVGNMYLEIHFLNSHLDFFPENLGTVGDKNEEHFHQGISNMKSGTKASAGQVCWQTIYWMLKTDAPQTKYSKKSTNHLFGK